MNDEKPPVSGASLPAISQANLPPPTDPRWERWRKRPMEVRMMPLVGPITIVTVDAPTELPSGWAGWLAVDLAGHPYPLHRDVQQAAYEPASETGSPDLPDGMEMARQLRDALGLFTGAPTFTPLQSWEEALAEVRRLRDCDNGA